MKGRLESHIERLEVEELVARAFMSLGVLWWLVATVSAFAIGNIDMVYGAGALTLLCLATLVIGLWYEGIAGTILVLAAGALISYGVSMGWETGVWIMVGLSVILQMVAAAAMMFAAVEEETVVAREAKGIPIRPLHA